MRLIEPNTFWTITSDFVAWFVFNLGISYACVRIPLSRLAKDNGLYRLRRWEREGRIYLRTGVKRWKRFLPDGGALFGRGFRKKQLDSAQPDYLDRFLAESRRAELTHWLQLCPVPVFFLWNDWRIGIAMILYAVLQNFPCIVTQRYNRGRLTRVSALSRRRASAHHDS
jgi:glycosyl-4,4'-diaponeurosporenoate acyltransferase